ncbi:MAG: flagellar hook protein FlgE [Hyphomicrobiaceae bacterium]
MSVDGMMNASVSGMAAQSRKLSAISGNIANASTIGYKRAEAQFATLLAGTAHATYAVGGVEAVTRYGISRQGILQNTDSKYDLAISGNGFMLVADQSGSAFLTRAGAFVPDASGRLINSAGYTLLGMPAANGNTASIVVNSTAGLEPVVVGVGRAQAVPTDVGRLTVNLPSDAAPVAAGDLPSANLVTSQSSARSSVVVYGNLGEDVTLDFHYARTTTPGEWEVSVYNAGDRAATGGTPYATGPLASATLIFDALGQLDASSPTSLGIPVPGGATMTLDLTGTTQLAADFEVRDVGTNGQPASDPTSIEFSADGTIYQTYQNGARSAVYRIPLANVTSPDRLVPRTGNVYEASSESGDIRIGVPGGSGLGNIASGALESSTVDLAAELTEMIAAQRNYTANSRVFQTGAELMEIIVNLKR